MVVYSQMTNVTRGVPVYRLGAVITIDRSLGGYKCHVCQILLSTDRMLWIEL